jgi:hypothetical protein
MAAKWQQHVKEWHAGGGRQFEKDVNGRSVTTDGFASLFKKQKKLTQRITAYMRGRSLRTGVAKPKSQEDYQHRLLIVLTQMERHLANIVHIKRVEVCSCSPTFRQFCMG